jgi:hypothetical protein
MSLTENPRVGGSIPPLGTFLDTTTFSQLAHSEEQL